MTLDNDAGSAWIDCPDPMVTQKNCAADIRSLCNASSMSQKYAMLYAFSPGCHGSTSNITTPVQDIANFLLVRGTSITEGGFYICKPERQRRGGGVSGRNYGPISALPRGRTLLYGMYADLRHSDDA